MQTFHEWAIKDNKWKCLNEIMLLTHTVLWGKNYTELLLSLLLLLLLVIIISEDFMFYKFDMYLPQNGWVKLLITLEEIFHG